VLENGAPNPRLFGLDVVTFAISPDGKWMVAFAQQRLWLIDLELHIKADVPLQFSDPENIPPYVECLNPERSEFFETGRSFDLRKLAIKLLHTMCYDVDGTLLFADKYVIRRITEDRTVKPAAGHYGCGWEDGPATTHAKFFYPRSIVCDKDFWYVLDQNKEGGFTARQVTRTSRPVVSSVATVTAREDNVSKFALCPSTGNLYLSLNCKGDILRRCPGQTSFEIIASSTTRAVLANNCGTTGVTSLRYNDGGTTKGAGGTTKKFLRLFRFYWEHNIGIHPKPVAIRSLSAHRARAT
jgi:hypothetical protein